MDRLQLDLDSPICTHYVMREALFHRSMCNELSVTEQMDQMKTSWLFEYSKAQLVCRYFLILYPLNPVELLLTNML